LSGQLVQDALAEANITSNKNPVPFDSGRPSEWVGLRLGVSAATTRGLKQKEFGILGDTIASLIKHCSHADESIIVNARETVSKLCDQYPIYS